MKLESTQNYMDNNRGSSLVKPEEMALIKNWRDEVLSKVPVMGG